MVQLIAAF